MSITENLSLAEELFYLRGYVTLQNLRLNFPVLFLEEVPSLEDQEILMIPPMLIQPILENAIFHGLSPLEDQGQILLKITLHTKTMKIIVEDNGVGRKEAMVN